MCLKLCLKHFQDAQLVFKALPSVQKHFHLFRSTFKMSLCSKHAQFVFKALPSVQKHFQDELVFKACSVCVQSTSICSEALSRWACVQSMLNMCSKHFHLFRSTFKMLQLCLKHFHLLNYMRSLHPQVLYYALEIMLKYCFAQCLLLVSYMYI